MIVFSSPVAAKSSPKPLDELDREPLTQTPWWNITFADCGGWPLRGPLDQTRSGFMRTIQPSSAGRSAPTTGL